MRVFSNNIANAVARLPDHQVFGRVADIVGLMVEIGGLQGTLSIGDHVRVDGRKGHYVICEVIGFRDGRALVMPFGSLDGIGLGCQAELASTEPSIYPDNSWLGRVIDAFGTPLDDMGPIESGMKSYQIHTNPPPAHKRRRVGGKVDLGVRVMNTFLTTCRGQRMGIFAGSGVGKSTLLGMMVRGTDADVSVIVMVGERGREVREFIEDELGPAGLGRAVVVVATSDEPPLMRRRACFTGQRIAEWFADQGRDVLLTVDSLTRLAMAQRDVGLAAGEPPTARGYTPSVFSVLPQLLERAGPRREGTVTAFYTVLVEGDDMNDPIADTARSILDGHLVLSRALGVRGHYPAIDPLASLSRLASKVVEPSGQDAAAVIRRALAAADEVRDLVEVGAYVPGTNPDADRGLAMRGAIDAFLRQDVADLTGYEDTWNRMHGLAAAWAEAAA